MATTKQPRHRSHEVEGTATTSVPPALPVQIQESSRKIKIAKISHLAPSKILIIPTLSVFLRQKIAF